MASTKGQDGRSKRQGHLLDVSRDAPLGPDLPDEADDWSVRARTASRRVGVLVDHDEYLRFKQSSDHPAADDGATEHRPQAPKTGQGDAAAQDLDAFVRELNPAADPGKSRSRPEPDAFDELASRPPRHEPRATHRAGTATADMRSAQQETGRDPNAPMRPRRGRRVRGRVLGVLALFVTVAAIAIATLAGHGPSRSTTGHPQAAAAAAPSSHGSHPASGPTTASKPRTAAGDRAIGQQITNAVHRVAETLRTDAHHVPAASHRKQKQQVHGRASSHASHGDARSTGTATTPPVQQTVAPQPTPTTPAPSTTVSAATPTSQPTDQQAATSGSTTSSVTKAFGYGGLLGSGHSTH